MTTSLTTSVDNKSVRERDCENEMKNDILQVPIPCDQVSATQHANLETVAEQDRPARNCSSLISVRRSQRERHIPQDETVAEQVRPVRN